MNAKSVVTLGLLLFVAASVVGMVLKDRTEGTPAGGPEAVASDVTATFPTEGVAAFYFHGNVRCPTCRNIETMAQEAVTTGFTEELQRGTVTWQVVNCELPANKHYIQEFELVAPTVVLVKTKDGEQIDWRNLMRVWELVSDKQEFIHYVQQQTHELLDGRSALTSKAVGTVDR